MDLFQIVTQGVIHVLQMKARIDFMSCDLNCSGIKGQKCSQNQHFHNDWTINCLPVIMNGSL